jgi:hypothetical protein
MPSLNANANTQPSDYRVWEQGETPRDGVVIKAMSSYDARRIRAAQLERNGVTNLMARRVEGGE